jgi:hypothetical protein
MEAPLGTRKGTTMKKKSSKLSLGRETVVRLDAVSAGAGIPRTSGCVSQGPLCQTNGCVTDTCHTCLTECYVSG